MTQLSEKIDDLKDLLASIEDNGERYAGEYASTQRKLAKLEALPPFVFTAQVEIAADSRDAAVATFDAFREATLPSENFGVSLFDLKTAEPTLSITIGAPEHLNLLKRAANLLDQYERLREPERLLKDLRALLNPTVKIEENGATIIGKLRDSYPGPENEEEFWDALVSLHTTGEYVGGGGAASAYALTLVASEADLRLARSL